MRQIVNKPDVSRKTTGLKIGYRRSINEMSGAFAGAVEHFTTLANWIWAEKKAEMIKTACWALLGIVMMILYTWLVFILSRINHHLEPPVATLARLQRNGHCMECHIDGIWQYRQKRASEFTIPLKSCIKAGLEEDSTSCFTNCDLGFGGCLPPNDTTKTDPDQASAPEEDPEKIVCVGTTETGKCTSWCKVGMHGMVYDCDGDNEKKEEEEEEEEKEAKAERLTDSFSHSGINIIFGDPDQEGEEEEGLVDTGKLVKFCVCRRDVNSCACETAPLKVDAEHGEEFSPFRTTLDLQSKIVDVEIGNSISMKRRRAAAGFRPLP